MLKSVSLSPETLEVSVQYADSLDLGDYGEMMAISEQTWQTWLRTFLEVLNDALPSACGYELTLRLTDDAEIQGLNRQYRFKDQATDVLAFAALESDFPTVNEQEPLYLGDIVVSLDTAQRQATQRGHSLKDEVIWLTSHGLLHLLGWDHPDEQSLTEMLEHQKFLLKRVGIFISLR